MSESGLSPAMEAAVARLVREGRHAEAARLCEAEGALGEASTLFAAVWEWSEAIASAERAGLFELAYRHAISAGLEADVARLVAKIAESPEEAAHLAPDAERNGRALDAARLFVAAGALEDAARCFALAGAHEEAGACLESSGRYRDAGRAYEAALRSDPEAYAAALSLGRILARMGRYEQATRAL
ncbi:MAG: hypothetical protein H5U40_11480, partial [Polyangiaceae bacterium]|nr:hypothetical protein [Polyangiaceae bacterium]